MMVPNISPHRFKTDLQRFGQTKLEDAYKIMEGRKMVPNINPFRFTTNLNRRMTVSMIWAEGRKIAPNISPHRFRTDLNREKTIPTIWTEVLDSCLEKSWRMAPNISPTVLHPI